MSQYQSIAARVPAAHRENLEKVLSLIVNDQIQFGVGLSATPHSDPTLANEGFGAGPATHYGMNNEGTPLGFSDKIDTIKGGPNGIDEVLPGVQWGTGDLPSKEDAVAAVAAAGFFQRLDPETTAEDHFNATCGKNSQMGLREIWI